MAFVTSHFWAIPTQRIITSTPVQNHIVTQITARTQALKAAKIQSNEPVTLLPNSNAGGDKITEIALDYWRRLKRREDIPVEELQDLLSEDIFRNPNSEYSTSCVCVSSLQAAPQSMKQCCLLSMLMAKPSVLSLPGGFFQSQLIQKNLIDYFIPFLPLEYKHVKQCVREELRAQGHPEEEDLITEIASAMADYPSEERLYSRKGCKTVASRVALST